MSLDIETFTAEPSVRAFPSLKWAELTKVAEHYKLTVTSGAKKGEIQKLIIDYLHEEEFFADRELEPVESATTLRYLELEERAKEREAELKVKELQLREKELEIQLRMK